MATEIETNALEKWRQRVDAARQPPATLFEVAHRRGIWEVTKDGRFLRPLPFAAVGLRCRPGSN
jgi:hypothetical protein